MAKLTKSQARKRLEEARNKVVMVMMNGGSHLTQRCVTDLFGVTKDLKKQIEKLK